MDIDLYLSNLSYDIENYMKQNQKSFINFKTSGQEKKHFEDFKKKSLPDNIELIGANYDKTTSTTVLMCRDKNTGEILASCTGTNFGGGFLEGLKDVLNWADIFDHGINPNGPEIESIIKFFNKIGVYPSRISGHSLGGCIAQIVGLRLNIDIEVYNSAPLFTFISNLISNGSAGLTGDELATFNTWKPLIKNYSSHAVDYVAGGDPLTWVSGLAQGTTIGEVIRVNENDSDWKLSPHYLETFNKHDGFIDEHEQLTHLVQSINRFNHNDTINIDINNDQVIDITRTKDEYKRRELFNPPQEWNNTLYQSNTIKIDPTLLTNLSISLRHLSDTFISEELAILDIIEQKNITIKNNKDNRITITGNEIKYTIKHDLLKDTIDKISKILAPNLSSDELDLSYIMNTIISRIKTTSESMKYQLDTLYNVTYEIDSAFSSLVKYRKKVNSHISDLNTLLDNVYTHLANTLAQKDHSITNNMDDYVCSMFSQLLDYLKSDVRNIKLFLEQSSELIKSICDNFTIKDSAEARAIYQGIINPLKANYMDVRKFNKLKEKNVSENNPYYDFYNFDAKYEQQVNIALQDFSCNYIAPLEDKLPKIVQDLLYLDTLSHFDLLLFKFTDVITERFYDEREEKYLTLEQDFFKGEARSEINSIKKLQHKLLQNGYNDLCYLAQQLNLSLYSEGILNYLFNMIMEVFYNKFDFDEQIASLSIMCYDLSKLGDDIKSVILRLQQQKSVALKTLANLLQEIADYCYVFVERVNMIFDNVSISTKKS